jgi:hypothetical protein
MRHSAKLLLLSTVIATGIASVHSQTNAAVGCRGGHARLAGHYYLNGVMEVGSELLMRKDGSFEFYLAYGANDQYGKGCWAQDGNTVALVPAGKTRVTGRHTPESMGFTGMFLQVDGKDLVWDIGGSGHKGRYEK